MCRVHHDEAMQLSSFQLGDHLTAVFYRSLATHKDGTTTVRVSGRPRPLMSTEEDEDEEVKY